MDDALDPRCKTTCPRETRFFWAVGSIEFTQIMAALCLANTQLTLSEINLFQQSPKPQQMGNAFRHLSPSHNRAFLRTVTRFTSVFVRDAWRQRLSCP